MSLSQPLQVRNALLMRLSEANRVQLLPKLRLVPMPFRKPLFSPGELIDGVYFMESGYTSMVTRLDDGSHAEVGLIGREGLVGLTLLYGVDIAYVDAFVQGAGEALFMDAAAFRREISENIELNALLLRYAEAINSEMSQHIACNGKHNIESRLACWLLMARDRAEGDELPLTQDFLAMMLCVYRPSVTTVAGSFQRAGMIRYSKGILRILDRPALERTACGCYQTVRDRFKFLLG